MDHLTAAQIVLGRLREREVAASLTEQRITPRPYQIAYQRRQSDLRGDDYPFDFTTCSLQKRLLDYFEATLGLPDAAGLLRSAEKSRQALRDAIWETTFTGLHAGNKELRPLIKGFTEFELFVLNEIVISSDPDKVLMEPEAVEIAARKLAQGGGTKFITYLSKRLELQRKKRHAEPVNLADVVRNC